MAPPTGWNGLLSDDKPAVRTPFAGVPSGFVMRRQRVSIIDAQRSSEPGPDGSSATPVRVTLHPLQRNDRKPTFPTPGNSGTPVLQGLRAGWANNPFAPAPNGIVTANDPFGAYVHVRWGLGGAKPSELVAHWPVSGASIELVADHVYVEAVCGQPDTSLLDAPEGAIPRFAAEMGPTTSRPRTYVDALSFSQLVSVPSGATVAVAIPEWAAAVELYADDPAAVWTALNLLWIDPFAAPVGVGTLETLPARVAVPAHALQLVLSIDAVAANVAFTLDWRIAP